MRYSVLVIYCTVFILSCGGKEPVDQDSLNRYLEDQDNGLKKTHEENSFKLSVTYKPVDFFIHRQMQGSSQKEYDSISANFSKYIYFNLSITHDDKDLESTFSLDPESLAYRISFLSSDFSKGIKMLTKKDTLDILDYIYQPSNIGTSNFLLVFHKPESEQFEIQITGYQLGFGKVSFPFEQSDIDKTPHLKMKL